MMRTEGYSGSVTVIRTSDGQSHAVIQRVSEVAELLDADFLRRHPVKEEGE
ncbi:MAG: hypothetical protein QM784_28005 [Polyangiaceae bacterium]